MHFLNREDGSLIGRMSSDGSPILSTPLIAGDKLVFQTRSGTLMAVTTE
jgi:outer membrane protein assembly factor BamB